jgi:saccharopine dehydrogenase (NAD+, L-lysine-forming)
MKKIYIRDEYIQNEYRTPLIPKDVKKLVDNGFIVYIESSNKRVYNDNEYLILSNINQIESIHITTKKWYDIYFQDALIIGLKELDFEEYSKLNNHTHIYFSHCYKNQDGSQYILSKFKESNSYIYDFEYFVNVNNKRLISFGFYAGIVGGFLGIYQYIHKKRYGLNTIFSGEQRLEENKELYSLTPYKSYDDMVSYINKDDLEMLNGIKIGIIGYNGKCGNGVINLLNKLNIKYTLISRDFIKEELVEYDIFYNCILLDDQDVVLFDEKSVFGKSMTIVDISCDYTKSNNPIKLYKDETTWENPVYEYVDSNVNIIAISNLPSLLPKDSSDYFSSIFVDLLLDYNNPCWENNRNIYLSKIESIM